MPPWARILLVVYLAVVAVLVGAVLVLSAAGVPGVVQGLVIALAALTLPVSVGYLFVGLLSSAGPPSPEEFSVGALSGAALAFYLGYLVLGLINAAVFRWLVLSARKSGPVPAVGDIARGQKANLQGVNPNIRKLLWTVPLAVLLTVPQWLVAMFAWCGISGCSGGGFGVSTGSEWLAVTLSAVNGLIVAVAVFAVPWLYPTGRRVLVAVAAGLLFALAGAAYTHG